MGVMEKSMIAPTGARPTTRSSHEKLRKDVKALNEKLDKLILAQSTMKKVNFVSAEEMEPVQEGEDTQFAEDQVYPQQQQARSSQPHNMGMVKKQLPRPSRDFSWSANAHTTWLSPPTTPACTYLRMSYAETIASRAS
ncbi:unnamed protein product [Microthlaspi erraticum]|uniref:Uncharacterized protein n=1 Tax=Microthlaspi erraticum TaxID=1685480 RepID=A0A6D2L8Y0_9BRAS|nr:unnamed protein product [Microthlaspi erraticum]